MSWFSGYGGKPTLNETDRNLSYLEGIGQTNHSRTGARGRTATEAYRNLAASGASQETLDAFTKDIARLHGRL